jgi:hypothetical protein
MASLSLAIFVKKFAVMDMYIMFNVMMEIWLMEMDVLQNVPLKMDLFVQRVIFL